MGQVEDVPKKEWIHDKWLINDHKIWNLN
jgi:hypothetical protein